VRLFFAILLVLPMVTLPSPAFAWWEYGHATTARIAMTQVTPKTRAAIARLIRASPLLDTPTCPIRTIDDASVWADCIKGLKDRFSYQSSWHYQNVDVCRPFDLKTPCADGNCVSAQVARNARLLADKTLPVRERVMALAYLVHFMGDLHMPLHAGDRSDRGGNDLKAAYGIVAGRRLNIHSVWDGYLAERAISTSPSGANGLAVAVADRAALAAGTPEDWSRESWQVARDSVYAPALGGDPCGPVPPRALLDEAQIDAAIPVVRLQMQRGGTRLARMLDEALD